MSSGFFNRLRLHNIERSLEHLRKAVAIPNPFAPKQADIETLQQEVGELRLLVAVLYRLLLDKGHVHETELHALLSTLDASDGQRDGSFAGDPVTGLPRPEIVPEDNELPKIRVS